MQAAGGPPLDWRVPQGEPEGVQRYLQTLRERIWVVVLALVVTVAAAGLYLATASQVYEAEADLLVTPIPGETESQLGSLGLVRESSDPLRAIETTARLIATQAVAERAAEMLSGEASQDADALLTNVQADPVAESNIVTITAAGPTPEAAAERANTFAEAAIEERTEALHDRIDAELPALEDTLEDAAPGTDGAVADQVSRLELLRASDDPTLQLETVASPPTEAVSPRPALTLAAAILAGLVLGAGAAFGLQALDPRLRREDQLRSAYRLPILTRIPKERSLKTGGPILPGLLSPEGLEAYRTLRTTLDVAPGRGQGSRAILVTSPSASEGKTTTAVNLAFSLARAGNSVVLVDSDLRNPKVAESVGVVPGRGIMSVLIEDSTVDQALVDVPGFRSKLKVLGAEPQEVPVVDLLSARAGLRMVDEVKRHADYVVIDSPPLTEVIDALPLATATDDVVLTVRLGSTSLRKIADLTALLGENRITPSGFVIVGTPRPTGYYAQGVALDQGRLRRLAEETRKGTPARPSSANGTSGSVAGRSART